MTRERLLNSDSNFIMQQQQNTHIFHLTLKGPFTWSSWTTCDVLSPLSTTCKERIVDDIEKCTNKRWRDASG